MDLNDVFIISAKDWSVIDPNESGDAELCWQALNKAAVAQHVDDCKIEEFGIYCSNGKYHTTGYVGINWLKDENDNIVEINRKKVAIAINPRFKELDPWEMLVSVINDNEYESYLGGDPDRFYKIFYDIPVVAPIDKYGGEMLLVLSYLRSLQELCRKKLSQKLTKKEANFNGNVRGNIKISEHIKKNCTQGREDRIYCRYSEFNIDTKENQILKAALKISQEIIYREKLELAEVDEMVRFCKGALQNVKDVKIIKSDFVGLETSGFNSKYKDPLFLAKNIIEKFALNVQIDSEISNTVIPYIIKMETLFEFYIRSKIHEYFISINSRIDGIQYRIDDYRLQGDINGLKTYNSDEEKVYLMNEYIPDILIQKIQQSEESEELKYINVAVLDVKYQHSKHDVNASSRRQNTHQLLAYTMLLNVRHCGFIFPYDGVNDQGVQARILFQEGNAISPERLYSQWPIMNLEDPSESFDEMMKYLVSE